MSYDPRSPYTGGRKKPYVSGSERTKKSIKRAAGSFGGFLADTPSAVAGDVKKAASWVDTSVARPVQTGVVNPVTAEIKRSAWNDGGQIGQKQRERRASSEAAAAKVGAGKRAQSRLTAAKTAGSAGRITPLFTGSGSSKRGPRKGFVGGIGGDNTPKGSPRPKAQAPKTTSPKPTAPRTTTGRTSGKGASATSDPTKLAFWLQKTKGMKNAKNKAYTLQKRSIAVAKQNTSQKGRVDLNKVVKSKWGRKAYLGK